MIDAILEFFNNFSDFLSQIWDILVDIFHELIEFFGLVAGAVKFVGLFIINLPGIYQGFLFAALSVIVIYLIIGRDAGGD